MTEAVHILRCGWCKKPFSYVPSETDMCLPGTPNQICNDCYNDLSAQEPDRYEGSADEEEPT
jgi:hypothetical protein